MDWSISVLAAVIFARAHAINLLKFAVDFTRLENTGRIRICNFVNCWGSDNLYLVKETSANFRCSISVNPPGRPISDWFTPIHLQMFVVDLSCPDTEVFLREAERLQLFNGNFVWLVVNSGRNPQGSQLMPYNGTTAVEALETLDVTAISQVNVARQVSDDKFEIMGYYKRDATERLIRENLGYWTSSEGLVFTAVASPAVRRQNMEGRLFKAAVVITDDDSLNHIYDLVNPQTDNPSKLNYVFYDLVIQAMNASVEYIIARKWGESINGSFDGMIGYAERKEADLVVSPLLMEPHRMEVLHYVARTQVFRVKFVFLSPPLSYKNNIFLLPFSITVWYSCFAFFVISVLLLYGVAVYEERTSSSGENRAGDRELVGPLSKSVTDIIMLNLGTICQQDIFMEPKGICGRIVTLHVKVAVMFLYVSYSAAILVLLQSSDRSITTLSDLDKSDLKLGFDDTPYNRYYYRTASDPVRKAIVSKIPREKDAFLPMGDGLNRVRRGFYAFNVDQIAGFLLVREKFDETEKCRLQQLKESFMPDLDPMVAVRKNLSYTEIISIMFRRIHEYGLIDREGRRKTAKKPPCKENMMSYDSVGIVDCEGAFLLLSWGALFSFCIFILEIVHEKLRARRRIRETPLKYGFHH